MFRIARVILLVVVYLSEEGENDARAAFGRAAYFLELGARDC